MLGKFDSSNYHFIDAVNGLLIDGLYKLDIYYIMPVGF